MYAFEKEVREVQEMVQRRETLPTGVSSLAAISSLLFATIVCFLPICVFYQFYLCEIGGSASAIRNITLELDQSRIQKM